MKLKSLTLLFLLIPLSLWAGNPQELARMNVGIMGSGVTAAVSCPGSESLLFDQFSTDGFSGCCNVVTKEYRGQASFAPATDLGGSKTICSVSFDFRQIYGDITGINFQIEIYEMSGNNLGNAPTGTCISTPRGISGSYPIGEVKFEGLNCSLVGGTTYGIAIIRSDHGYDGTNYPEFFRYASDSFTGYMAAWNAATMVRTDDDVGLDVSLRMYGY